MKTRLLCVLSIALAGLVSTSCSDYQKLLNGDDTAEKYKQAEVYYNNGEYRKANRLLEQIIPKYRESLKLNGLFSFCKLFSD